VPIANFDFTKYLQAQVWDKI